MSDVKPADAALLREIADHEYTSAYLREFHGAAALRLRALADLLDAFHDGTIGALVARIERLERELDDCAEELHGDEW